MSRLINITKLSKILDLVDPKTKKPLNHTLRFWEKEFTQIKPKKINNQRYYSKKDIETIKIIKTLIKDKNISIKGVKKILSSNTKKLDDHYLDSLKNSLLKSNLKTKSKNILNKIEKLKSYGKKNSSKS